MRGHKLDQIAHLELGQQLRQILRHGRLAGLADQKRNESDIKERLARYEGQRATDDPLAAWQECLEGGDAERGRRIFFERAQVSCVRCHKIGPTGGEVGPDLSKIAADKKRDYLLEAIVAPSKTIAKNFESVVIRRNGHGGVSWTPRLRHDGLESTAPAGRFRLVVTSAFDKELTIQ